MFEASIVQWLSVLLATFVVGCASEGGRRPHAPQGEGGTDVAEPQVEKKVILQRLPDGRVKKTTVTITKRTVEAPPPPPRPADPYPSDPRVKYNVDRINAYRAEKGLAPLLFDAKISAFARGASERLSRDHVPHAHFAAHQRGAPGFGSRSAENQGDERGVPALDADPVKSGKKQIDEMLKLMMDEGPGGGHHDNMMNPRYRRVGIGLVDVGGKLYLTNDFSD
jgi:hypothetical protein